MTIFEPNNLETITRLLSTGEIGVVGQVAWGSNFTFLVQIEGDEVRSRTYVLNPMGFQNPDGSLHIFTVGAYYIDELVRTGAGWRIKQRVEEQAFLEGTLPEALQIPS